MTIEFNKAPVTGDELLHIKKAIEYKQLCGDGLYGKMCQTWFEQYMVESRCLLTPSCTAALEICALLLDIKPGDEVILPSYTFVSTANAFVLRGAKAVFIDIRPDTMNLDEALIESAITNRTKAIVVVHYAGVSCEMDTILSVAKRYSIPVVEDAAQGMMSTYKGRPLGSLADFGTYSFHETKNYTSGGEGGLLIINNEKYKDRAEVIREKGTNRKQFFRGMVDKYQWVDLGSSFLPSEIQAAFLWAQLEQANNINSNRLEIWKRYNESFQRLSELGHIELPKIPSECEHNAHMYYIKVKGLTERTRILEFLKLNAINAAFHYVPLHSSRSGKEHGRFQGADIYTTKESERLVRLPIWFGLPIEQQEKVISKVYDFFEMKFSGF